jgi:NAD(P)H-hydrate epimerase
MGVIAESAAELIHRELESTQALLVGPGFGRELTTGEFIRRLFGAARQPGRSQIGFVRGQNVDPALEPTEVPCVIDADALKLLADIPAWHTSLPDGTILTPHPGEMRVLTGEDVAAIQEDRVASASRWAEKWGHIVVLKGAFTVVAGPDGRSTVVPFATPALARAGTGDVLAGLIVGLLAQGVSAYRAALLACYLHGRAGEIAALALGSSAAVIAGDIADAIVDALAELEALSPGENHTD